MSFVNRIYFLTACWSSIRVVQSDAVSMSSRDDINVAVQGSSTPVTISLTAGITNFNQITVGNGKDVTIVSNNDQQKTLTAASNNRFFVVEAGGSLTLERITLVDGGGGGGGGAISNYGGSLTVTGCTFSGNTAVYSGGAIYNSGGSLTVTGCTFSGNTAGEYSGGGVIYNDGGSLTVTSCTFSNNNAGDGGGAIHNSGGSLTVTGCTFSGNTAGGDGGAILNAWGSLTVTSCTFSGNTAYGGGGAISNDGAPFTVTSCTFSGNAADDGGDDIYHSGELSAYSFIGDDSDVVLFCWFGVNNACPSATTAAPTTAASTTAAPTTAAPTTAAPVEASSGEASSNGDPHLQFADGGSADFRGSHNGIYNMLTSDGISVNALFREQDFFQSAAGIEFAPPGSKQGEKFLVHGTFIFEMCTTVRTSSGRLLHLRTEATPTSAANVAFMENNVPVSKLDERDERIVDNVKITTKDGVATIETPGWVVLCKIVRTKKSHFLNLSFKSLTNDAPHGIIGQSYDHDGIAVDGAKDVYNSVSGGETTTTAQAEGAIEGAHSDYLMESLFATAYKYSRFNNEGAAARDIRKLVGPKKTGVDRERRKLAFLLQRMAGKDNFVGAE